MFYTLIKDLLLDEASDVAGAHGGAPSDARNLHHIVYPQVCMVEACSHTNADVKVCIAVT